MLLSCDVISSAVRKYKALRDPDSHVHSSMHMYPNSCVIAGSNYLFIFTNIRSNNCCVGYYHYGCHTSH